MIRQTNVALKLYTYHRNALPIKYGTHWGGKWGAISRFHNRTCMVEAVKPNQPITMIDRDMMNYVHRTKVRHWQLFRSYTWKMPATVRKKLENEFFRRRWQRRYQKSFIAFMQFEIKKTLEEKAKLVNKFGQASINRALGDPANDTEQVADKKWAVIRRQVRTPRITINAPKHVATMKQIHNDRFNQRWRQ